MTKIIGIVAVGPKNEIGFRNRLIYSNPADMAFFCGFTQGKLVVLGRKTAESIPKPLFGRTVYCLTTQDVAPNMISPCVDFVWSGTIRTSFDGKGNKTIQLYPRDYGRRVDDIPPSEIVIAGGASVYEKFAGKYDEFYVTRFTAECSEADTFFPEECLHGLERSCIVFRNEEFTITRHFK